MRPHILLLSFLFAAFSHAQQPSLVRGLSLERRSEIGPLILKAVDPEHLWISVAWDPKTPSLGRRINGKVPEEALTPEFLRIQLSYIGPRYSRDPAEQQRFKHLFVQGAQKLLERARPFWFEVTDDRYAGPGQIGGVFLLDEWSGPTLQQEMIRCGYATVRSRDSSPMVEKYFDDYRDKLLRLEGQAQAYNLGIWSR